MITHSRVVLTEDDIAGVLKVLRSGLLSQGDAVMSLEKEVASFMGVEHAVAVSSGTAALHLSLLSLGITEGLEVIIPSYVCTALLNAIHYVGATPVVVDINPHTYNIGAREVNKAVSERTGAVIVPHLFGLPADIEEIVGLGIPVIEDCAHSVGARFKGRCVGTFGNLSIISLYATKMLCGGEGGLVLSNNSLLIEKIRDLMDYDEKEDYLVRYNYKLTDIQAALGGTHLDRLPWDIQKRVKIAEFYSEELGGVVRRLPLALEGRDHVYYRYVVEVDDPEDFMEGMMERGIECRRPVFKPLHRYLGFSGYSITENVWSKAVSIPMYPSLGEIEAGKVVDAVKATSRLLTGSKSYA